MLAEVRPDCPSDWPAIVAVAQRHSRQMCVFDAVASE
jgi:hypothetical protein